MKNLKGFICKDWLHATYNYWRTTVTWNTTTMIPVDEATTVKDLLNTLKQENTNNDSYISIYHNLENSDFKGINETDELKEYFSSKITWILCIQNDNWIYYDVAIDHGKIRLEEPNLLTNTIERTKSTLTNFNFEKYKNPGNIELLDWYIDSGDEYHIEPNTTVTVEDLLSLIKEIGDKNILISVDSAEVQETTPYINANEISDRFKKCEIKGWSIIFGNKGTYYSVSTWFDPNEEDSE